MGIFLFKQKTAYEMRISDWSSDVCSSDLLDVGEVRRGILGLEIAPALMRPARLRHHRNQFGLHHDAAVGPLVLEDRIFQADDRAAHGGIALDDPVERRSEEHTSELQSLMRISYAVFCLKKKKTPIEHPTNSSSSRQ